MFIEYLNIFTLLTAERLCANLILEEITAEEQRDHAFMLERIATWEECDLDLYPELN